MADLQELFSRLSRPTGPTDSDRTKMQSSDAQAQQASSIWAQPQSSSYEPPSVSSPIFSPPIHTPNPIHSSIMSPNVPASAANTPGPESTKAASLLDLLLNNSGSHGPPSGPLAAMQNVAGAGRSVSAAQPPSVASRSQSAQARNISASDLVASFHQKPSNGLSVGNGFFGGAPSARSATSPIGNPQDFLLNLLNRPSKASAESPVLQAPKPHVPGPAVETLAKDLADTILERGAQAHTQQDKRDGMSRETTPARVFGTRESKQSTPFEPPPIFASKESTESTPFDMPNPDKKGGIFNYVNPFEQLAASSPRNRTPKPDLHKHQRDVSGTQSGDGHGPAAKQRRVEPSNPVPALPADDRGRLASATGIAPSAKHETVSEALSGVGETVDKQVEQALAQAGQTHLSALDSSADIPKPSIEHDVNADPNKADDDVADSWESADVDSGTPKEAAQSTIDVFNFPMKPFVSIEINGSKQPPALRPESLMDIARLKKDFDQIDRTLVTATSTHIVYALSKSGFGYRIIRQDSGRDKQVFRSSQERVFNVQVSHSPSKGSDVVLATSVNGSVYWTEVASSGADTFSEDELESQSFILPPVSVQEDGANTSGSPVKTRAKMSSRHADFFAISRAKSIHIISPYVARLPQYTDKKSRIVDNDKYLDERSIKISTGKAGKDFAFSEDDTLLVSLDKAGRIKFWDIREMSDLARDGGAGKRPAAEQKLPLWTLNTTTSTDKASPTSVMFVDKERPSIKGVALRYLIVGLKQNHVLQLWDLGLGKPVQELHFPHDKDSDAICSIAYHPKTGIVAVGHPTRNSIYFIHLSAPRYHIPNLDQARYVTMLAAEDPHLPKPESTAIMSGIRELSFASKGQLRSLDMLKTPATPEGDDTVFELYAMHSKGVTCLNIKKQDLGWSADNKVIHPVDAEKAGVASISPLRAPTAAPVANDAPANSEPVTKPAKQATPAAPTPAPAPASVKKPEAAKPATFPQLEAKLAGATNGVAKAEKEAKHAVNASPERATNPTLITPESYAMTSPTKQATPATVDAERELPTAVKLDLAPVKQLSPTVEASEATAVNVNGNVDVKVLADSVSKNITDSFTKELDSLYRKFDSDKRVQDAASAAKQNAILGLVSSTLTDNVEKSLTRIVNSTIQETVVPAVTDATTAVVDRRLTEVLTKHLTAAVPQEIKASLPAAIARAMQDKDVLRAVTEQTASKLSAQVEQTFTTVLRNTIVPTFTNLSVSATQKAIADVERRFTEQLRQAEVHRQADNQKIEQLTALVMRMGDSQSAFQEQILKLQQQQAASSSREGSPERSVVVSDVEPKLSVEDKELDTITQLMTTGQYEAGTIKVRDLFPSHNAWLLFLLVLTVL